jgi:hypothetical protein
MSLYKIKEMARALGIGSRAAVTMRMRYLQEQIAKAEAWERGEGEMPDVMMGDAIQELLQLTAAFRDSKKLIHNTSEDISEKIAQARTYPIDKLVDFVRGKAACFAHDDKSPSAYLATRLNLLCCPVCDKKWDSIQILIERDNYTFHKAVEKLSC